MPWVLLALAPRSVSSTRALITVILRWGVALALGTRLLVVLPMSTTTATACLRLIRSQLALEAGMAPSKPPPPPPSHTHTTVAIPTN